MLIKDILSSKDFNKLKSIAKNNGGSKDNSEDIHNNKKKNKKQSNGKGKTKDCCKNTIKVKSNFVNKDKNDDTLLTSYYKIKGKSECPYCGEVLDFEGVDTMGYQICEECGIKVERSK